MPCGIVTPALPKPMPAKVAESIRARVSEKEVKNRSTGVNMGRITVSIGVASYLLGEELTDFIGRADAALYAAKNAGRNRVVTERQLRAPAELAKT